MKEKTLSPHRKTQGHFALKAFLWGAAIAAVFVIPCMIYDKGMYLYFGDYNYQVIPFYQLMIDCIHNGDIGWNWYTDIGSPFIGTYTFYNLGSPFFWVLLLFPSKAVPYIMGPYTILKFGLSSLTAYSFLRRYTKNKNHAVIAAILYAFSGAAIYNMVFHFIDSMVVFPLMLTALDQYIYEGKRGRFALAAALCALTNYYLFAGEAVFCLIFWIVRMATGSYKMEARRSLYLILEAILGTGMATALLLPTVYHVVINSRATADDMTGWRLWVYDTGFVYISTIISFFLPPEQPNSNIYVTSYNTAWSSITAFLPVFGMSGVFAVIFNKHRNKWLRVFYGVCAIFMFIPVLNSVFQLFTDARYLRWFFMLLLIMSLGSVMALEDPATKWKKSIITNLVLTTLLIVIVGLSPVRADNGYGIMTTHFGLTNHTPFFWTYAATAMLNIAIGAAVVSLYKRNKDAFKRYAALLVSFALISTISSSFISNKVLGETLSNVVTDGLLNADTSTLGIDDIEQWRSEIVTPFIYTRYMYDMETIESIDDIDNLETADPTYALLTENNDNYISNVMDTSETGVYKEIDNANIFWHIPGFSSFHSMISGWVVKFYEGMNFERGTLSNLPIGTYGVRSLLSTKYYFVHSDSAFPLKESDDQPHIPGTKYLKSWNGLDIYENEYAVPYGTTFDKFIFETDFQNIPTVYRHLVLTDTLVISTIDQMYEMAAAGIKQVSASDFDFSRESYFKNCQERIDNACYDYKRDNKGFEAKLKTGDKDEYVFFGVPYDNGWSATINGEKVDIEIADFGFMLIKAPANQECTIRFNYHTPGTIYGIFVSVICAVILLLYLAVAKVRAAAEADNETAAKNAAENTAAAAIAENSTANEAPKESAADEKPAETPGDGTAENAAETTAAEKPADNAPDTAAQPAEDDFENMTIFDIVKQTEEQTMMHVYNRVPVVLERGFGAVGFDINNKKYIDFTSGIGVNALGYADGRWSDAVEKQLHDMQHMSNLYYNTTQITLAELLCTKTGFSKVFLANSGAEANECAIKLARKYGSDRFGEKHTHIITLENSFHGRTITTLAATGQDKFHKYFTPFTEGFSYARLNDMDSIRENTTEDTCAVMIELIQGEGGVNPLDKQFVTDLAEYCKENDLLLIVDEIQTGVGRTGRLYCYENFGIEPDIITSAKALGGGLPLSACMCNDKLKDVLTAGTNGTTFGGNPIACAGAIKILDIISDDEFLAEVRAKGAYMRERIGEMKGVKEVRGMGLMIGIALEKDNAADVLAKCAENGLLVLTAKNVVRLLPPLNIEYEDIEEGLDLLEKSIRETLDSHK